MILGLDVSNHQAPQDWETHKAKGIRFGFCKATEGQGYKDPTYGAHLAAIKAAGLVRGSYHFARPKNDPIAEANFYLDYADPGVGHVITLDLEDQGGLSWTALATWKNRWLDHVKRARPKCRVGLYCNASYWKSMPDSVCGDFLWVASYTNAAGPGVSHPWMFWQYTDKPLDYNRCPLSESDLRIWAEGEAVPPVPVDDEPPLTPAIDVTLALSQLALAQVNLDAAARALGRK